MGRCGTVQGGPDVVLDCHPDVFLHGCSVEAGSCHGVGGMGVGVADVHDLTLLNNVLLLPPPGSQINKVVKGLVCVCLGGDDFANLGVISKLIYNQDKVLD